jgi:hypothetical protein
MNYKGFFINEDNALVGGIGDSTAPSEVDPSELAMGVAVEMAEHTHDVKVATEIAIDHLMRDGHYYSKLNQAGLTDEFVNVSPSGYGDPTSTFNQEDRLGNTVSCAGGNNIVGSMGNTGDGSIDGRKTSSPIINKTIDVDVEEPTMNEKIIMKNDELHKMIKECILEAINKFVVGQKAKISQGSGIDSGKVVTIVDKSNIKVDGRGIPSNVSGAYKPVDWNSQVAIQYEDGKYGFMFKNRLTPIPSDSGEYSHSPEMRVRSDEPVNDLEEEKEDMGDQMRRELRNALKAKDAEKAVYYKLALASDGVAFAGWDKFKSSWAYEQWKEKQQIQKAIQDQQQEFKRFNYLTEKAYKEFYGKY